MPIPTCPSGCDADLPIVAFNECAPEVNSGQISVIYLTNRNYPLTDWTDLVEWTARLSNTSTDSSAIRTLFVTGSWPVPEKAEKVISLGRTIYSPGKENLAFRIDETNQINHDFMRELQCGGQYTIWPATGQLGDEGKLIWGGNAGIEAAISIGQNVPESTDENITYDGTAKWTAKFPPERTGTDLIS